MADDAVRIYVREGHHEALEIPTEFEGLRTERVSTSGFGILAPPRQGVL